MVPTRCSGHKDQREPEGSRELLLRSARMGQPCSSRHWSVEQSLRLKAAGPGSEDIAQWTYAQFVAQMSVLRKSSNLSQDNLTHQLSLVWSKTGSICGQSP